MRPQVGEERLEAPLRHQHPHTHRKGRVTRLRAAGVSPSSTM